MISPKRRPVRPAVLVCLMGSVLGWAGLAGLAHDGADLALCSTPVAGLYTQLSSMIAYQIFYADPARLALEWGLMVAAMMLPLALPHVSVYVERLYRRDRVTGLVWSLVGFLISWIILGLVAVPLMLVLHALSSIAGPVVLVLAYAIAIAWAWSSLRLRAFRRCHAVPAPHGTGRAIGGHGMRYGMRLGVYCVCTCGFAMIAPMLAGQGHLEMAILTHVLLKERLTHKPRPAHTAVPLALMGALALVQAAL